MRCSFVFALYKFPFNLQINSQKRHKAFSLIFKLKYIINSQILKSIYLFVYIGADMTGMDEVLEVR